MGGFSEVIPGVTKTEAQDTIEYLTNKGISQDKISYDSHSLETLGNFTFPLIEPMNGNPNLSEFRKMLVIGKEGHMWRIKDCANLVFTDKNEIDFHTIPGRHTDGALAKIYHSAFMHALGKDTNAEKAHDFLKQNHPFYSDRWYEKSPLKRRAETALIGLSWFLR